MRIRLCFDLENELLPIQYRKSIMSFIKLSLSEYSQEGYKMLYNNRDNIIKPYTFAVFLLNPIFEDENILVESKKFELNMAIENYNIAIMLYNSFNHQKRKAFPLHNNSMILQKIVLLPEKEIKEEKIIIKFMSPLVVRSRQEGKDYYYSFGDEKFLEILKINIREQLRISNLKTDEVEHFKIEAIQPRKTVIKFYEKQIECSLGTYYISGNKELLEYLYKAGMRK